MTKEKYQDVKGLYEGKHAPKEYHVWMVIGPAGPIIERNIWGLDQAKQFVRGSWDHEIRRVEDGRIIP